MGEENNNRLKAGLEFYKNFKSKAGKTILQEKIDFYQDQLLKNLNQKALNGILDKIDKLKNSSLSDQFPQVGDQAADFTLENAIGETVSLKSLLKKGKVVVSFIRGGWCPYCYVELRNLQDNLAAFQSLGAQVLAISTERSDYCLNTVERNRLEFDVLSDRGNKVASAYNLVYRSETQLDLWDTADDHLLGTGLEESPVDSILKQAISNGDINYELPVPATFIIDEWQTIRYAHVDPDYRNRADAENLLEVLRNMQNQFA